MKLEFSKIQDCGNDYIVFDCFEQKIKNPKELSKRLSDRHYGIGGDGIVLIYPSKIADAKMLIFNSDGSQANMCGTGIRCISKHLFDKEKQNHSSKTNFTIEVGEFNKIIKIKKKEDSNEIFFVDMGKAELDKDKIPINLNCKQVISFPLDVLDEKLKITCVSMGNPHCVIFCENIFDIDIEKVGSYIENHKIFPNKTNVEFAKVIGKNIEMRVWERGNGETLSCSTGACACVVAAVENKYLPRGEKISVKMRGGELKVEVTRETVYILGGAQKIFNGFVHI
ncbi:MAG: diaminopimelate epimerase [Oscillospiraceae bacterium]|nr:diaminopimelate epimerase [Oscillospiraceae bacterium]